MSSSHEEKLRWLTRKLNDEGKLIEAGFVGLRLAAFPPDVSDLQVREMRMAFFAGAAHLFNSIMNVMTEDREPTDADMKSMELIQKELDLFMVEFEAKLPTKGNA